MVLILGFCSIIYLLKSLRKLLVDLTVIVFLYFFSEIHSFACFLIASFKKLSPLKFSPFKAINMSFFNNVLVSVDIFFIFLKLISEGNSTISL